MASPEDILALRGLIGEPNDDNGWTDEKLGDLIDASTTVNAAAVSVWSTKAAGFAELVDVSESGSSRKLGDLYKNAVAMAGYFKGLDDEDVGVVADGPVIARIRRSL